MLSMRYVFALGCCCCLLLTAPFNLFSQETDSLTVRVRDNLDNSPIINATVQLFNDAGTLVATQITGDNGVVGFGFAAVAGVAEEARLTTHLGNAYPNPFGDQTSVPVTLGRGGEVKGTLYDLLGKPILSAEELLGPGSHAFDIRFGDLPAGTYMFRLAVNGEGIGSAVLRHTGLGSGGNTEMYVVPGAGTSLSGADKAAMTGTYGLVVTHPNYEKVRVENIIVSGRTVRNVQMKKVAFVAEFGTDETRKFTVIANAQDGLNTPRDLEFHPLRPNELWTVNQTFDGTVVFYNAGMENMIVDKRADVYGNHFMEEVSAIAFSDGINFATAQESDNTYDHQAPANYFMGPALWTSDTNIYVRVHQNDNLLGSHIDMLHESPFGMGIAHDHDNVYWYFDGFYGNIVRYDFAKDHGPGYDDHSDGSVRRYTNAIVTRVPEVPGHIVLDKATGWLYICDPGSKRITRLNTKTGSIEGDGNIDNSQTEYLEEYYRMTGATYEILVNSGLSRPCGIALYQNRLFVTDNQTNEIIAYSLDGQELNRIKTPAEGIMGITVGPDGKLWYVDAEANQVVRVDP